MSEAPATIAVPISQNASLWRRFGAFVHELMFLVAYLFIVGLVFASLSGESMSVGRPQVLTGPNESLEARDRTRAGRDIHARAEDSAQPTPIRL